MFIPKFYFQSLLAKTCYNISGSDTDEKAMTDYWTLDCLSNT